MKGLQRPLCKVGKRIDLAKEIESLRARTEFRPARTGSPGIAGFGHRADASAAMQAYRARENETVATHAVDKAGVLYFLGDTILLEGSTEPVVVKGLVYRPGGSASVETVYGDQFSVPAKSVLKAADR